jgi:hypothetical protein
MTLTPFKSQNPTLSLLLPPLPKLTFNYPTLPYIYIDVIDIKPTHDKGQ